MYLTDLEIRSYLNLKVAICDLKIRGNMYDIPRYWGYFKRVSSQKNPTFLKTSGGLKFKKLNAIMPLPAIFATTCRE